jgi:ribose/xylose/arabinose/galactoside ABC-type transport system permease subunit
MNTTTTAQSAPAQRAHALTLPPVVPRLALLAVLAVGGYLINARFLSTDNLRIIMLAVSTVGVMGLGMTLVLLAGEIDLSVGGVAVLAGVAGGQFVQSGSVWIVIAATLGAGIAVGLINGLCVTVLRVPSLIVTLGTLGIARACANLLSGGQAIFPRSMPDYLWLGHGSVAGVPVPVVVLVVAVALALVATRYSIFGRALYAAGGNPRAAALSGVNVGGIRLLVFVLSGAGAALAGMLESARLSYIDPAAFDGIELSVIAIATLGGVSLAGGRGTIGAMVVAALIIAAMNKALNMLGISAYLQQIVTAGVILAVVLPDSLQRKERDT